MRLNRNRQVRAVHLRTTKFGRQIGQNHKLMQMLSLVALAASTAYLIWRIFATADGVPATLFWLLWGAEFVGWLSLALFIKDAWNQEPTDNQFGKVSGKVAVFIPTFNEDANVLEPSIMAAMKIRGQDEVWVLDDGRREWVRHLAREYGANYLTRKTNQNAKAGNINNALSQVQSDFVLILDADHVASAEILEKTLGFFVNEKVALVQTPHAFRNLDSAQHIDNEVNEQSLFFDVLLPGRQRAGAVFWCGSGGVLRTAALSAIGGLSTSTITEDLETTLALNRAGYQSVYLNESLLLGLAPQNLSYFLIQRYRWARGTLAILLGRKSPIFGSGFSFSARLSYLSNLVYYLVPIQHMVFIAILMGSFLSGQTPVNAGFGYLVFLWFPQLALTLLAIWGLSKGTQLPFGGSRNAWTTASVYARALFDTLIRRKASFHVTPKSGVETGGVSAIKLLWLPTVASLSLVTAALVRIVSDVSGSNFLPPMSGDLVLFATGFAVFELSVLIPLLISSSARIQSRSTWREPVDLSGAVEDHEVRVVDLHETGLKFLAPAELASGLEIGQQVSVQVQIENLAGTPVLAKGILKISGLGKTVVHDRVPVGGHVDWQDSKARKSVIEYCYLALPAMRKKS